MIAIDITTYLYASRSLNNCWWRQLDSLYRNFYTHEYNYNSTQVNSMSSGGKLDLKLPMWNARGCIHKSVSTWHSLHETTLPCN